MALIKKIQEMKQEMTRWRQKLHAEPELAFDERTTARFISRQLQSFGLEVHSIAKTGVVGVLHGRGGSASVTGGKSIMLRADMDALPVHEDTGAPHASCNAGVHHACGHDGHMAMLMGAAKHLAQSKNFNGTVYFVFQPAEEDGGGAQEMIKEGLFQKFPCDEVYGMHNFPGLPLGTMATGAGPLLSASDEFRVTFIGTGGVTLRHGETTNIIGAAAEAIAALKSMSDKAIPSGEPAIFAVTSIRSDTQDSSVLPAAVTLLGSIRTFDQPLHDLLKKNLEEIIEASAEKYGAAATVEFKNSYPILVNSVAETNFALEVARDTVGEGKILTVPRTMGVDDFAHYLLKKPGNYIAIGTGKADGSKVPDLHSAKYDFNDAALPIGASYWVTLVEKALPISSLPPVIPPLPGAPRP